MTDSETEPDWNIDDYHDDTEPEDHWQLRKKFMKQHKDKFPEDYLVALARTFANIELMGCSYPLEVQRRVAELSKDIVKKFREKRKSRLKRTFVSASTAAGNKVAKK